MADEINNVTPLEWHHKNGMDHTVTKQGTLLRVHQGETHIILEAFTAGGWKKVRTVEYRRWLEYEMRPMDDEVGEAEVEEVECF